MEAKTGICEQVMTFVTPQSVGISRLSERI